MLTIHNKKAIVTGAASGIGKAIAIKLWQEGVTVLAGDIQEDALQRLSEAFPGITGFSLDVTDARSVARFFQQPEVAGAYWLVNNAGVYPGRNLFEYTLQEILQLVKVNNIGAVWCTQQFAQPLLQSQRSGAIVNISSVSGQHGSSDAIYGMTKAALLGFTKSTAISFAPYIRVNAVAPGLVNTGILNRVPEKRLQELRRNERLETPITPEAVADAVYFLLSDGARHITGATLDVNNGQYMR